jgi:hypothetical protein
MVLFIIRFKILQIVGAFLSAFSVLWVEIAIYRLSDSEMMTPEETIDYASVQFVILGLP